jgi:Transposase
MSRQTNAIAVTTIGIDTGKNTLHLIGLDEHGTIVLREKLARGRIRTRLANVPPCLIGIEAGMATHYVARELLALGHDVRQVPPAYAKPFRQGHKNDFRDAHAIAEAVQRPSTRCVSVKTEGAGTWERELSAADDSSWHRPADRECDGRGRCQWRCFYQRTRLCRLARLGAEADVDR